MTRDNYVQVSGWIFAVVAAMHVLRLMNGWDVVFGTIVVPPVGSVIGAVVAGFLAYTALRK